MLGLDKNMVDCKVEARFYDVYSIHRCTLATESEIENPFKALLSNMKVYICTLWSVRISKLKYPPSF
jgi:hypothetical protein